MVAWSFLQFSLTFCLILLKISDLQEDLENHRLFQFLNNSMKYESVWLTKCTCEWLSSADYLSDFIEYNCASKIAHQNMIQNMIKKITNIIQLQTCQYDLPWHIWLKLFHQHCNVFFCCFIRVQSHELHKQTCMVHKKSLKKCITVQ